MGFNNKTKIAALKMFGEEHERQMPHPLKQLEGDNLESGITKGSAAYNALNELNMLGKQDRVQARAPHTPVMPGTPQASQLPGVNLPTDNFTSGSYANPTATTDPDANANSSTITYDFMEDTNLEKDTGEHRNKFGFWKRNKESIQHRIDKAKKEGKLGRAARLQNKLETFNKNQENKEARVKDRGSNRAARRAKREKMRELRQGDLEKGSAAYDAKKEEIKRDKKQEMPKFKNKNKKNK